MNWDDLRFVLALSRAGSLARAAKELRAVASYWDRSITVLEQ